MALQLPTNCTFDIYRGFNKNNPYDPPNRPAAFQGKRGILKPHMRNGRFGFVIGGNVPVYWTNQLLVAQGTDLRTAYNAQMNTFTEANGDTVMMYDYPTAGTCTAFVVVQAAEMTRNKATEHLAVYLDRARPSYLSTCPDPTATGTVSSPCCAAQVPVTLIGTFTNKTGYATNFPNTAAFIYSSGVGGWQWLSGLNCGFGVNELTVRCGGALPTAFTLSSGASNIGPIPQNPDAAPAPSCSPFQLVWTVNGTYGCGAMSYKLTLTQ